MTLFLRKGEEQTDTYEYDHEGRRVRNGDVITLYEGYNAIAEYDRNTHILKHTYAWGVDMSGSLKNTAGGAGGLLNDTNYTTQIPVISYPLYDGNGNVTEYLVKDDGGRVVTHYEYDSFGNVVKKTGNTNYTYQFSTRPYDTATGLNYYNYRYYDPVDGRWTSRDLAEEEGGLNTYCIVGNDLINGVDVLGNWEWIEDLERWIDGLWNDVWFDAVHKVGNFGNERLPNLFLRKYISGDTSDYNITANELLEEVKPLGSLTSSNDFKADLAKPGMHVFKKVYTINFMDTGNKTGGLGRFNLECDVEVCSYGGGIWDAKGTATFKEDKWDFDANRDDVIKEMIILFEAKWNGVIPWLAGRHLRTYIGKHFVPGKPFSVKGENLELDLKESSYDGKSTLSEKEE